VDEANSLCIENGNVEILMTWNPFAPNEIEGAK